MIFKACVFKKTVAILILNSANFTFFIIISVFTLFLWIPSERLLTRFDNELAINLPLPINCRMYTFSISSPFLLILVTSFSIGTEKVMYFSLFFPEQLNCFSNSSANSFIICFSHIYFQIFLYYSSRFLSFDMSSAVHC